jgi:D-Tyr-tRNAtyr deacylase
MISIRETSLSKVALDAIISQKNKSQYLKSAIEEKAQRESRQELVPNGVNEVSVGVGDQVVNEIRKGINELLSQKISNDNSCNIEELSNKIELLINHVSKPKVQFSEENIMMALKKLENKLLGEVRNIKISSSDEVAPNVVTSDSDVSNISKEEIVEEELSDYEKSMKASVNNFSFNKKK